MSKVDSHCGRVTVLMTHYGKVARTDAVLGSDDRKWLFKMFHKTYSQSPPLSTKFLFVIIMLRTKLFNSVSRAAPYADVQYVCEKDTCDHV